MRSRSGWSRIHYKKKCVAHLIYVLLNENKESEPPFPSLEPPPPEMDNKHKWHSTKITRNESLLNILVAFGRREERRTLFYLFLGIDDVHAEIRNCEVEQFLG